jgi:CDP-glucose 4,6-dehydratase
MAAQPLVRESYKNPVYTYETNVMGTVNILDACRHCGSIGSIVNVTTDKVYENKEWVWGYRETENLCGHDPYSNSKSCSELVTHSYKNSFFNTPGSPGISTARSGNVIGGGDFSENRIIPDCVRAAEEGKNVVIRNPKSIRPYQHVIDCISGYLLLAGRQFGNNYSGSYNFGPDENDLVDNEKLVDMFCAAWGSGMKSEHKHDGGPHEANFLKLDASKAKSILGWKPAIDIKKAVELTVEWHKAHISNGDVVKYMDSQIKSYFGKE